MKRRENEEKQNSKKKSSQKIWKIVSVSVIILFVVIIIGGLIKALYIKSSFVKPTQEQIDFAGKIATERMKSMHQNASMFQMRTNMMRKMHEDGKTRGMMQVSFYNNSTMHTFLVDVNSGEVLLHSETDVYGSWMNNQKYSHHYFMPFMMRERAPMMHGEFYEDKK